MNQFSGAWGFMRPRPWRDSWRDTRMRKVQELTLKLYRKAHNPHGLISHRTKREHLRKWHKPQLPTLKEKP